RLLAKNQRRMAERLGAAGQNEIRTALANVLVGGVDRLHAGAAVDLDRECGHRIAHAEAQCRDACRVGLVSHHVHAAENDLVECVRSKRLAQQQRSPARDREINWRERAGPPARAQERRAAAVDDIDRAGGYSAAVGRDIACDGASPCPSAGDNSSGAKSSTATAAAAAAAAARSCAASAGLIKPCPSAASGSLICARRKRSRNGCAAMVSAKARSTRARPSSPRPWKMSAVSRSR